MADTHDTFAGAANRAAAAGAADQAAADRAAEVAAPTRIGATGGLDLARFQQEVADEIGLGPDALNRLGAARQQAVQQLEDQSHSR